MTDTEILHDAVNFFERSAQFHSNPTLAEEERARAAAIRRVIARVAELEAQVAALTADAKEQQP